MRILHVEDDPVQHKYVVSYLEKIYADDLNDAIIAADKIMYVDKQARKAEIKEAAKAAKVAG